MSNFKIHYLLYAVVIGLSVGWLASTVATSMITEPKPMPRVKREPVEQVVPVDKIATEVINSNIFALNMVPKAPPPRPVTAKPAPKPVENKLDDINTAPPPPFNAKLLGIFQAEKDESGYAIIGLDKDTLVLSVGEVAKNIKLISLHINMALVESQGKRYSLSLEDGNKAATPARPTAPARNTPAQAPAQAKTAEIGTGENVNLSINRNDIKSELKDLNKVLQSALVSPFYSDGQYLGYRVTRMKQESPLAKLGLSQGDVITRINGTELKSPEPLFGMLGQIDEISAVSIDIIRNNEKKSIFVDIN